MKISNRGEKTISKMPIKRIMLAFP
jgi:hypothetical protein